MRLMEVIEEAQRNFLRTKRKDETINANGVGQSKISSKRWKN